MKNHFETAPDTMTSLESEKEFVNELFDGFAKGNFNCDDTQELVAGLKTVAVTIMYLADAVGTQTETVRHAVNVLLEKYSGK